MFDLTVDVSSTRRASRYMTHGKRIFSTLAAAQLLGISAGQCHPLPPQAPGNSAVATITLTEPVSIESGALRGVMEKDDVTVFRGVPYAAPPIGKLRWRAPQPALKWQGVRVADKFGFDCMQGKHEPLPEPAPVIPPPQVGLSEDCLTLNIWTPSTSASQKLPVMVWFHGGGLHMGAGSWNAYDGTQFALGGVVLITVNYRLGPFGFFAHPALSAESPNEPVTNFGILDSIAALQWVKHNVAQFGGDPSNVTAFGESAGGVLVNLLMVSPLSKGLFHRAISQSGPILPERPLRAAASDAVPSAEAFGLAFAEKAGVAPNDLAALRAIPADKILALGQGFGANAGIVIDGKVLDTGVAEAFKTGRQHAIPYMVGTTDYEGGLLSALVKQPQLDDVQQRWFDRAYNTAGNLDKNLIRQLAAGDAFMTAPARFLARSMEAVGVPAFHYAFTYVPQSLRSRTPGAWHGAEINYVFGTLNDRSVMLGVITAKDQEISNQMQAYWIAFAKAGNPNHGGDPIWPPYTADTDETMVFSESGARPTKNYLKERLDFQDSMIKR